MTSMGRLPLLQQSLRSLRDSGFTDRVIVIEQGARESGTREWLLAQPVDSLFLNKNYGKAYAWNAGLRLAGELCGFVNYKEPSHVLLCDDDVLFCGGWEALMVETLEQFYPQGLRSLSGFRHRGSAHRKVAEDGGFAVVVEFYHPGCCILSKYPDAVRYYGSINTAKAIGFVEGPPQKRITNAGFWCGSVPVSCIEHTGEAFRSYGRGASGGLLPKPDVVNMGGPTCGEFQ
jgi:glycosyltransferase involved in cell wall biosynthesis